MMKRSGSLAVAALVLAACSDSSLTGTTSALSAGDLAPSFARTVPGTPGDPNCKGQTMAFLAQAGKIEPELAGVHGIGGLARAAGASVQEVHAVAEEFCNTPPAP